MGEIVEKRKRHYVGPDADKDTIPAAGKEEGDSYFSNDKVKQYYWNGAAWKTGLGSEYIPVNPAAVHFDKDDFVKDLTWKVNGLDLTARIPEGTKGVIITIALKSDTAGTIMRLRRDAADYDILHEVVMPVANLDATDQVTVPIDSDRLLDYIASNVTWATLDLTVVGYYI